VTVDLGVDSLDAARDVLEAQGATELEARSTALAADISAAESRLTEAVAERARAQADLGRITGDAEIARLSEQRMTLELEMQEAALEYLERDLGLRLAEEAIRRYRDQHRSGMMAATEAAFSKLTGGAYRRLLTQPQGSREILLAEDAQGAVKQAGDMSKGTRFQLYLALRAAAYEELSAKGVQLPFFCDDIFETFDEERTKAACRLMEHIGRKGQAIYLTHHRHVVEIAREVCAVPPKVHEI
jgi:uncharacterized protein YhaN